MIKHIFDRKTFKTEKSELPIKTIVFIKIFPFITLVDFLNSISYK